jgi:hypothetical protein
MNEQRRLTLRRIAVMVSTADDPDLVFEAFEIVKECKELLNHARFRQLMNNMVNDDLAIYKTEMVSDIPRKTRPH